MPWPPSIHIVDDDQLVRESLGDLLRSVNYRVELYRSASEFLDAELPDAPGCLVLDVRLPGTNGLELQAYLRRLNIGAWCRGREVSVPCQLPKPQTDRKVVGPRDLEWKTWSAIFLKFWAVCGHGSDSELAPQRLRHRVSRPRALAVPRRVRRSKHALIGMTRATAIR
jgi:CheY-like chemotaxis protein